VHEPLTAEEGQPDVDGGATAGEPEPDEVRDELNAQAMDYSRCVEAVAALADSTTVSYARRGTGPVPEAQAVVDALRIWLDPQTIGHFPRMLIERLLAADHLETWSILAGEYDWGVPLLWLAQRCSVCRRVKRTRKSQSARCDERSATTRRKWQMTRSGPAFRWRCRRQHRRLRIGEG
jgi:hypothetical protein